MPLTTEQRERFIRTVLKHTNGLIECPRCRTVNEPDKIYGPDDAELLVCPACHYEY